MKETINQFMEPVFHQRDMWGFPCYCQYTLGGLFYDSGTGIVDECSQISRDSVLQCIWRIIKFKKA